VRDCYAASNAYGFAIIGRQTTVSGCVARENTSSGFYLTDDVSVTNCLSVDNASNGYQAIAGGGTLVIYGCHAITNAGSGYTLNTPTHAHGRIQINNSASVGNTLRGFVLTNAHQCTLSGCTAVGNQQEGIQLTSGSHHNLVDGCYVAANGQVADSTSSGTGADGVIVESGCNNNSVQRCTARQGANFYRGSVDTGTVTPTTTTFAISSDGASNNDVYIGCYLRIISGTQSGQEGFVTDYDASTKTITLGAAIAGAPDNTSVVTIVGSQLYAGTIVSGSSTSVVLPTQMASSRDDVYNNAILYVTAGTGIGQYRTISDYTGSSRTLTLSSALTTALDTTSNVAIVCIRRPRYGLRINATSTRTYAVGNDLYYGGSQGGYSDAGTSTDTSSANRST
jgi:parallel beta-helix repeat protein